MVFLGRFLGLAVTLFALPGAAAAASSGTFGEPCKPGFVCDEGICDRDLRLCVPCGGEGQPVCRDANGAPFCTFPSYGYAPMPLGNRQQICITQATEDCGQIGLPACSYDGQPVCRFGVLTYAQGGVTVCGACGDFGQACCLDTDIPCDYGTCQGGVCLPDKKAGGQTGGAPAAAPATKPVATKQAILDLIKACRLSEARALHAAADPQAEWYDDVTRQLTDAIERENEARALFDKGKASWAEAGEFADKGDDTNATLAFHQARSSLSWAKVMSRCPETIATIDEAIALVDAAKDRVEPTVQLDIVRDHIELCDFDLAGDYLAAVPQGFAGRGEVQALLDEALDRESRVMELYRAAQNIHAIAKDRLLARNFKEAAEGFADARDGFLKARQLTHCAEFRETISEAIAVTGRNLDTAVSLAVAEDQDRMPERYAGGGKDRDTAPPTGAHPCLDSKVPSDGSAGHYRQYFGGGGTSFTVKGQFICGLWGEFTVLTGSEAILNDCTREGDRYVDCRETRRIAIENVKQKDGATEYYWKTKDGWQWITVFPPK